jgi:thiol:disulfide interchange protein DsbD
MVLLDFSGPRMPLSQHPCNPRPRRLGARFGHLLALSVLVVWTGAGRDARADDDFLPPEQAYPYTASADGSSVQVTYAIRPGYYLYRDRIAFATTTPGATLGRAAFPKGLTHHDDYFGDQEIYRGVTVFRVPYAITGSRPAALDVTLRLQGCADAGLCYPPQNWVAHVALPGSNASTPATGGGAAPGGVLGHLLKQSAGTGDGFLPVDDAYRPSVEADGAGGIRLRIAIAPGYYLYRDKLRVASDDTRLALGTPALPPGLPHADDYFGEQPVYRDLVEATVPLRGRPAAAGRYQLSLSYQGCADAGLCYPPRTQVLAVMLPAGPALAEGAVANAPAAGAPLPLAALIGLALLGGLLLNLMPCVLPVLSIKAVSLASAADADAAGTRAKGFAYTAGVLASMLALAAALIALRAAGAQIGWGFQLQSPRFVLGLCYLLLLVGLNLSGVFEIGGELAGIGDGLTRGDSKRASFFTGILTTLVATPCTAPFMATAVGVALTQSAAVALLVFAALGVGLALPYLLLTLAPALRHVLPRPGPWMTRFREALAFPMYLSAGWLLWVLAQQAGPDFLAAAILGLILVALAAWSFELRRSTSGRGRPVALLVAASAFAAALVLPLRTGTGAAAPGAATHAAAADGWEPFDAARVAALVAAGRPVFVVFTADWCVTCKVNERVAIGDREVEDAFRAKGVVRVKADWTRQDDAISQELARRGRAGVPLYLFYRPRATAPEILPQVLTPGLLRDLARQLPG